MNLSAPAMSRTLTRIRETLNDPILVRSGRGLVPTPRALELREQVRGVVELAHGVFTQGQDSDLSQLDRTFSIRAKDVFFRCVWRGIASENGLGNAECRVAGGT